MRDIEDAFIEGASKSLKKSIAEIAEYLDGHGGTPTTSELRDFLHAS